MIDGARSARALVAFAAGAFVVLLGTADAQTGRTAAQAERERRAEATRAERLRREAETARRDVRALNERLTEAARRRADAEAAAISAEARLVLLRQQLGVDEAARRRAHAAYETAIIAAALSQRRAEPAAYRVHTLARAAGAAYRNQERERAGALAQGRQLEAEIAAEQLVLAAAQTAIDNERTETERLLSQRRAAETRLASDAAAADRRARRLAAEARSLRELASRVAPQQPARGAASVPAAWLAPAQGRIVSGFGARAAGGPASQGVVVRTRSGAQVVAPAAGEIAYAGPFRSYGQVLILNLDGGYACVLTGLDSVSVRVGEAVRAGQPVGEMSASAIPAPELYVEVRRGGQPVDPGRWLNARGLTAENGVRAG